MVCSLYGFSLDKPNICIDICFYYWLIHWVKLFNCGNGAKVYFNAF